MMMKVIHGLILTVAIAQVNQMSDEKSLAVYTEDGDMTFTYQTYMEGKGAAKRPMLRGEFKLVGKTGEWKASDHIRICAEFGSQQDWRLRRDKIRWLHYGDRDYWQPIAESAKKF